MPNAEIQTTTNPVVIENAKESEQLKLDVMTLLGIFSKPGGNTALIRLPNGATEMMAQGDRTQDMTVAALDDTTLHMIGRSGKAFTLQMPKG